MLYFALLAFAVGTLLPLQAGVNGRLAAAAGNPALAALASFAVGTATLAAYAVALRPALPAAEALARLPWWYWTGGVLGAFFVAVTALTAPRLGATALTAVVVAGQLLMSLALDHFGLAGFARRPADPARVLGVTLVLAGALLTLRR